MSKNKNFKQKNLLLSRLLVSWDLKSYSCEAQHRYQNLIYIIGMTYESGSLVANLCKPANLWLNLWPNLESFANLHEEADHYCYMPHFCSHSIYKPAKFANSGGAPNFALGDARIAVTGKHSISSDDYSQSFQMMSSLKYVNILIPSPYFKQWN